VAACTCSPSRAKSAESIDGASSIKTRAPEIAFVAKSCLQKF
jgi:hypothetical protein